MIEPGFASFERLARKSSLVPVWKTLGADLETPVSAYLKLSCGSRHSFLFEGVEGGEKVGRYTYLGTDPFLRLTARGGCVEIVEGGVRAERSGQVLDILRELTSRYRPAPVEGLPPFRAGAVGYAGYGLARQIEPRVPPFREDPLAMPDAAFLFFATVVAFDHARQQMLIVASVDTGRWEELRTGYEDAVRRIADVERTLSQPVPPQAPASGAISPPRSNMGRQAFCAAVERAKQYILAGDVFQAVLSHRLDFDLHTPPFQVYRALRAVNPSPFLYYLALGEWAVLGASPELLVKVEGREVTYRPIAGTQRRGKTAQEDRALEAGLLADEKELAEHVMLVDLGRNDLGRVCEFGSVRVPEFKVIERCSHVMHIASGVRGRLRPGADAVDALAACFPPGTMTGAPKVRAMEIIAELEPHERGVYSGAVLYLDFSGALVSSVAIRLMAVRGGKAHVQAGAGIVADSSPGREWEESLAKGRALIEAAGRAARL